MIWSYFDDSSDDKRSEYFAAGGVYASENHWLRFESEWIEATKHLKEPFRSTDCECQHGQFQGWDKPDCDALMARLVGIVVEHNIGGFGAVVPIADFRVVFPQLDHTVAPYLLAVEHTILNMARMAAMFHDNVEFWFELGTAPQARIDEIFFRLKNTECWEYRDRLWATHGADKRLNQLQAADLVARETVKHCLNRGIRPMRKPFERMKSRVGFLLWNREVLEHIRERNWPDNPAALACWSETDDNPARPDGFYGEGWW